MPVFREPGVADAYDPHSLFVNPSSTNPTLDNQGEPLIEGAWYYNTTANEIRFYDGSAWGTIAPTTVGLADGTQAAPALFFNTEVDTGIYKYAANTLGITAGGTVQALFAPTGVTVTSLSAVGSIAVGGVTGLSDGTVSAPGASFSSDTNTGLYRIGADNVAVATNGTKALEVDASQRVFMPLQPAFYASMNVNTSLAAASGEKAICATNNWSNVTEHTDVRGNFDTATGEFTAPVAGVYEFHASITLGYNSGKWDGQLAIKKNGSGLTNSNPNLAYGPNTTNTFTPASLSMVLTLAANDVITARITANNSTTIQVYGGHFCGRLIG